MKTVTVKTAELEGAALDWAVASICGKTDLWGFDDGKLTNRPYYGGHYSTEWHQTGPLIDKYNVQLEPSKNYWIAKTDARKGVSYYSEAEGLTALIAICRAILSALIGDTVEIPEELIQ